MTTAVKAYVHDQPFTVHFGKVAAVEFSIAPRPHVGHVDVAHPPIGGFVDLPTIGFNPVAVAGRTLITKRLDHYDARFFVVGSKRQLDFITGLVHQQLSGRHIRSNPASAHSNEPVTRLDGDPWSAQW